MYHPEHHQVPETIQQLKIFLYQDARMYYHFIELCFKILMEWLLTRWPNLQYLLLTDAMTDIIPHSNVLTTVVRFWLAGQCGWLFYHPYPCTIQPIVLTNVSVVASFNLSQSLWRVWAIFTIFSRCKVLVYCLDQCPFKAKFLKYLILSRVYSWSLVFEVWSLLTLWVPLYFI